MYRLVLSTMRTKFTALGRHRFVEGSVHRQPCQQDDGRRRTAAPPRGDGWAVDGSLQHARGTRMHVPGPDSRKALVVIIASHCLNPG